MTDPIDPTWRNIRRVHLHESDTLLFAKLDDGSLDGGIFSDYGSLTWRLDGDTLVSFLEAVGVRLPHKLDIERIALTARRVPIVTGDGWGGFGTENQAAYKPWRIAGRIAAPHVLELALDFGDGFVEVVTYCGTFTVEWSERMPFPVTPPLPEESDHD